MTSGQSERVSYIGRFAPTPSGPLHHGSLMTALASYLEAQRHGGRWLLRIDDLDRARCPAGMDGVILRQLEAHRLHWHGRPRYQAQHVDEYRNALTRLQSRHFLYACHCTRAELALHSSPAADGPVYAGTCRELNHPAANAALRLRIPDETLHFADGWQGEQRRLLRSEVGDFVVWRADDIPAYQLACVIDEAAQGITDVVRGTDLLGSTFRQIWIQRLLDLPIARYRHLPVLTGSEGRKLSKQNQALAVRAENAGANLWRCLQWLGQQPPAELAAASAEVVLDWACRHWRPEARELSAPTVPVE